MKPSPEKYACVFLSDFATQTLLRFRPDLRREPCVVLEGEPPLQKVCSLNDQARLKDAAIGMTRVELDSLPTITILPRSQREEQSAKALLLECAWTFSPRVEEIWVDDTYCMVIDITGTEMLLGKPESVASSLQSSIAFSSFNCAIAVSGNFHTSILLARSLANKHSTRIIPPGQIQTSLAPLSLSVLDLTEDQAKLFHLWGIHSLGMLAELPELEIIARLGQEGKRLLKLAKGTCEHYFLPVEPTFDLTEFFELDTPVFLLDSLLFIISTLLDQLILRVTNRILAIRSITTTLTLEGNSSHERAVSPALPTNDRALWIKLIHLDLEAHPPNAPIVGVRINAIPGVTATIQRGLFAPQSPEPDRLDVTLARIRSIVGEGAVGYPQLLDSHRPDAFKLDNFQVHSETFHEIAPAPERVSIRKLRPWESIKVLLAQGIPYRFSFRNNFYIVEHAYGPWQKSGDWWNSLPWKIEQWDIIASCMESDRLYCSLAHHCDLNRWFIASLYD